MHDRRAFPSLAPYFEKLERLTQNAASAPDITERFAAQTARSLPTPTQPRFAAGVDDAAFAVRTRGLLETRSPRLLLAPQRRACPHAADGATIRLAANGCIKSVIRHSEYAASRNQHRLAWFALDADRRRAHILYV
jgi:hypothetical protein